MSGLMEGTSLRERLEAGFTLPASWYSDPGIHELERERILAATWQYAGRAGQAAEPGSFFASQVGHVPVVVVRDGEGVLRAFVNVCRHRGHLVCSGEGLRETLQCPYHAWTYGLDGTLRRAPRSEREPGFDPEAFSLLPVAVDTWGPFVFCNPDPDAAPLADSLGELPSLVAESGLKLDTVRFRERIDWEQSVNWKVAVENYLECYHCPVAHPSFSRLIDVDPDAYRLEAHSTFSSQFGPVRDSALNGSRATAYDPHGEIRQAQYHFLYPTTTINVEPGRANISIDRWLPAGPHRTIGSTDYFFGEDVPEEAAQAIVAFAQQVGAEDQALVESVQAGLDSGMVPHGRLLAESEQLIAHFQRLIVEALDV